MKIRKTLLEHILAAAIGLSPFGGILAYDYLHNMKVSQNIAKLEIERVKAVYERNDKERAVKEAYPEYVLRMSKYGRVTGNQNILLPEDVKVITICHANPEDRLPNGMSCHSLFYKPEDIKAGFNWSHLYHENDKSKTFKVDFIIPVKENENITEGVKKSNLESIAVTAENIHGPMYIKVIGEEKNSLEFSVPPSQTGVEEIVIKMHDNRKGDDVISICRAPIVYGDPKIKIYMDDFNPEKISLVELDGKKINIPLTMEIKIPELGITNVYYVKTDENRAEIPLDWYLHNLKTPTKLTANITIKDQSKEGKVIATFNRKLEAILDKEGMQLIDPYDSNKNSEYNRHKRNVKIETSAKHSEQWLYVFTNFEEGTAITQELWGTKYELKITSIDPENKTALLSRYPYETWFKDIELKFEPTELLLKRSYANKIVNDTGQLKRIKGNHKSRRFVDFYICDQFEMPK